MYGGLRAAVPSVLLVVGLVLLLAVLSGGPRAHAQATAQEICTPVDSELAELSGLASVGDRWFAVSDGGTSVRVFVLDPADCAVLDEITAPIDPYDVEDLALSRDGALWLADTGDNGLQRGTVALHRLTPSGDANLYRLTYPDGPHDAEALLLDQAGVPYLVTKELAGTARVYRPARTLAEPGPTPLEQVATVRIEPTRTPGGPAGNLGSVLVTGGAVSADGRVIALRTYTDAYLFSVPEGDILSAFTTAPVRIPLPHEPQGEALALAPDGTLLSGSEGLSKSHGLSGSEEFSRSTGRAGIRAVPGATALVLLPELGNPSLPVEPEQHPGPPLALADDSGAGGLRLWQLAAVVTGLLGFGGLLCFVGLLVLRRRQRLR